MVVTVASSPLIITLFPKEHHMLCAVGHERFDYHSITTDSVAFIPTNAETSNCHRYTKWALPGTNGFSGSLTGTDALLSL